MASIELTVAYPGREGAHSAAACDRESPAQLVALRSAVSGPSMVE